MAFIWLQMAAKTYIILTMIYIVGLVHKIGIASASKTVACIRKLSMGTPMKTKLRSLMKAKLHDNCVNNSNY